MALDKAIRSGKEHRRPYRGSKAIAGSCRNHGGCEWCRENRTHKMRDKEDGMKVWTMGYVGDGWEVHDTDDERTCENCQYWDGHSDECRNPESEYYESTRHYEAGCDEWEEWKP